jgi:hypothetical protein
MIKKLAFLLLLAVLTQAYTGFFVLNGLGETLSEGHGLWLIDNNIATVGSMPYQIVHAGEEHMGRFWVVCSGENSIEMFDYIDSHLNFTRSYSLPAGSNPYLMHNHSNKLWTSLWVSGQVAKIDIETGATEISAPFSLSPQGVFADDNFVYISDGNLDPVFFEYGPGILWKLDMALNVIDSIFIGTNPQQIVADSSGNLHIICTGDYYLREGSAYIVDRESFTVIDSVLLGGTPQRIVLDIDAGIAYSATSLYESWVGVPGSGRLLAYNIATHEVIWDVHDTINKLDGTGQIGLDVSENQAFVPSMDSSFIEIVEITPYGVVPTSKLTTGYGPLDVVTFEYYSIEESPSIPQTISISAHPNPFNSSVRIIIDNGIESPSWGNFSARQASSTSPQIEVEIYDINGRHLETLATTGGDAIWSPSEETPAGVYLISIKGSDKAIKQKIVYSK